MLLKHLYILSVELYNFVRIESKIVKSPMDIKNVDKSPIKLLRVNESIKRKDFFVNRNAPTMTLKEFADKLMLNEKIKEKRQVKTNRDEENDLRRLRERDEFRDDKHFMRGNTLGKG